MFSRAAMAAVFGMLLMACSPGANAPTGTPRPDVQPSAESPTPTPRPSRAPVAAMPADVLGDWHGDDVAIPGLTAPQLVRLSLSWDGGRNGWIQFDGDGSGRQVLNFLSLTAPDGQIRVSSDGGAGNQPKVIRTSAGSCGSATSPSRPATPTANAVPQAAPTITPVSMPKPLPAFTPSRT